MILKINTVLTTAEKKEYMTKVNSKSTLVLYKFKDIYEYVYTTKYVAGKSVRATRITGIKTLKLK